jgi:regulator of sigma E protease
MGPVAVVGETVQAARTGPESLSFMLVMISIALALMNLLPLPALDGGRILFVLVGAVRRRAVDLRVEAVVHASGVLVLTVLLVVLSWKEIGRYFTGAHESAPSSPDASSEPAARP